MISDIRNLITHRVTQTHVDETTPGGKIYLTPFFPERNATATKELKENFEENFRHAKQPNQFLFLYQLERSFHLRDALCLTQNFPWILNPTGSFTQHWELFTVAVTLYTSVTYPYYIVFVKDYPNWFTLSLNFVDFFWILDLIILLTTAIEESDKMVTTFMEISQKRVMQFGFYLDFVSCVRIELFYWIWTKNSRFGEVLRLNRLLKIYRIPKLLLKIENKIEVNSYVLYVIKYIFYIIIFGYLFGAFLYVVTCFEKACTDDGWFFRKLLDNIEQEVEVTYTSHEVLTSMYFALSCITGLTPGDILPSNITDMITSSFVMICGKFTLFQNQTPAFFSGIFTFGCCVSQSSALLTRKLKVRTDFQDILYSIVKFMKRRNMGSDMIRRVKNYLILQWHYDRASILKQPLLFNLDKNSQTRIHMDEKMNTITGVSLFRDQRLDFLLSLAINAQTLVLPPNEFVTYKGEVLKILYIIEEGYCIRQFGTSKYCDDEY